MPEAHRLSIRKFPRWKDDQTTRARGQQAVGQRARAQQVLLLAGGEQHGDVGARGVGLQHRAHAFEDGRHAGLVVGRQDGVARRAHDAVDDHGLDARARLHGVHMRREHHVPRPRARKMRDEVAGVGAHAGGRVVEAHLEAEGAQLVGAAGGHRGLVERRAFDTDEFAEQVEQTIRLHGWSFLQPPSKTLGNDDAFGYRKPL